MRIRAGEPPDPHVIERTLEAGFGALIAMEVELSRIRRAFGESSSDAGAIDDVFGRINVLRGALTELRTQAVPPGESRVGYGFVLPAPHAGVRASPS